MTPEDIIDRMYAKDIFSQWLGIKVLSISKGNVKLSLKVRKEMLNGFSILHGGISYALADTCLAFSANTKQNISITTHTSMAYTKPVLENDVIYAYAEEKYTAKNTRIYDVYITNDAQETIALFRGTVLLKGEWK